MFHTIFKNLVLILFVVCSSIQTSIGDKPQDYSIIFTKVKPYSVNIRLRDQYRFIQIISVKFNSKDIAVSGEKDQRINDLKACTTYNVEAMLQNVNTKEEFPHKQHITTTEAAPTTEINKIIPGSNSVNVSLRYINSNCANAIQFLINNDLVRSFDKSNLTDYVQIDGLGSCTLYQLWVKTYYQLGYWNTMKEINVSETFSTETDDIPPIEKIEFNDVTSELSWQPPVSGLACIKNYEVKLANHLGDNITTTNDKSLNLSAYPGCSKFTISIVPKGLNGKRFAKSKSKDIQTGIKEPSRVMNLMGSPSSNSITIRWGSPNESPECVKKYEVEYSEKREMTDSAPYTIYDLEPCRYYTINVCPIKINDKLGKCEDIGVTTTMGIPSSVKAIRTSFSNSTQTYSISWDPPINGANCTQTYWILVYDELKNEIYNNFVYWPEINITANKLKSCHNYTVSVAPINKLNVSGSVELIIFKTQPTKPQPPTTPQLISKTATSLELQSDYKVEKDYCPLQAAIFKCQEMGTSTINLRNISLSQNKIQFTEIIGNLTNNTKYECSVRVLNEVYQSGDSDSGVFETYEVVADPPEITSISANHTTFTFVWNKLDPRIKLKSYLVKVVKLGKIYRMPDGCVDNAELVNDGLYQINANLLQYEITNLKPYTKYTVQMAVENSAGTVPDQVTDFTIANMTATTIEVKWNLPCEINGHIVSIIGQLFEIDSAQDIFTFNLAVKQDELPTNYTIKYNFKPGHVYNVTIGIKLAHFFEPINQTSLTFNTNAGIPDAYNSNDWGGLVEQESPSNNITLIVSKKLFSSGEGKIFNFTLLISERNCQEDPKPKLMFFINENVYKKLPTWYDFADDKCTGQYQLQEFVNDYAFHEIDHFLFIIGSESCDKEKRQPIFCNGPLKSGTHYAVTGRVFTSNGYADTQPIFFVTEKKFIVVLFKQILIILSILLLLGFFVTLGIKSNLLPKYVRNKKQNESKIAVKSFVEFYLNIDANVMAKEYQSIAAIDLTEFTSNAANVNTTENRYANIWPYDHNRFILSRNVYYNSDYINASYIDGFKRKEAYIASVAPTQKSCYEFWNMVIESKCHKIVMLTEIIENDSIKCYQYFPLDNELEINDVTISVISNLDLGKFNRREIKIRKGMATRLIVQYQFKNWSQYSCPTNGLFLTKFIRLIKSENPSKFPIIVHSCAGVGRTGVFIALDILMQQMQNTKYLNIYETVKKLRYQRVKMIQTFEQYEFLYQTAAQYVQWKWPKGIK